MMRSAPPSLLSAVVSKSLCPFCGAHSSRQCELEDETGGACPWQEFEDEPDEESKRKRFLADTQRRNPPMDMERWAKMDPLEVYWEIQTIRANLNPPKPLKS